MKARGYKNHGPTFRFGDDMSDSETDEEAEKQLAKELEIDDELEMEYNINTEEE